MKCKCWTPSYVIIEMDGHERRVRVGDFITYGWSETLNSPVGQRSSLHVEHRGEMKVVRFE